MIFEIHCINYTIRLYCHNRVKIKTRQLRINNISVYFYGSFAFILSFSSHPYDIKINIPFYIFFSISKNQ